MRIALLLQLAILLLGMTACTYMVPRDYLPPPLTTDQFSDPVKVVSIPLPIIATSPNEGLVYGALNAFLLHDSKDEVATLIAPQINQNENFGTTVSLFASFYPIPERHWGFNLSQSTKVNYEYLFRFRDKTLLDKELELNNVTFAFTDGSARFFGFGPLSSPQNETNYGDKEIGFTLSGGYRIIDSLYLVVGERYKNVNIVPGAVKSIPYIKDVYTPQEVPGIDGFNAHVQKLSLVYDTMDDREMPTSGIFLKASLEASFKALGSSADYRHYEAEAKGYLPLVDARFITVGRVVYNQTLGEDVPFLERSIIGGETTLRGYGRNRFLDSSYLLINLEERIRLFRWPIFNVTTDWELAPFIDVGAVMHSLAELHGGDFQYCPGIGFRAVVRPNIVGRVEIGVGRDGPAVFVGLGYPF